MKISASYHQERLWFIDTFESGNLYPSSPVYHNIPILLTITGQLSHRALEQSLREVIHRHEALRTRIITVDNKPVQSVDTTAAFKLPVLEVTGNSPGKEHAEAVSLAIEESQRPFLIDKEPLIRAKLFQINGTDRKNKNNKQFLLLIILHHVIADNYSLEILVKEIFAFYNGHLEGEVPRLPRLPIQYADFSQWQRELPAAALKSLLRYWKGQLKGKLRPLEMPTDRPRAAVHIFHAARQTFTLTGSTARSVRTFAKEQGIGIRVLLLAAFKALLHRYSGQEEVAVGISAENRTQPGTESIIGPVANLLAINTQIPGKSSLHELIADMKRTLRDALKYQAMPFDRLVLEINPHKDMSRTALFDVLFQYRENTPQLPDVTGLNIEMTETNLGWGKYDLNLLIQNKEEKTFDGILVYNADYDDETTIQRFIFHYKILLENLLIEPHKPIGAVSMLSEEEKHRLVNHWNRTAADFADDKTIHRVFAEQAERTPGAIALYMPHKTYTAHVTYAELNRESDLLAKRLLEKGVRAETIVAVQMGRSSSMIAVLLGILKAGGAYLPIDPDYPKER
ncbi:MAG: AMP-binding protein, partial [bacterium]|nr:AMP-binding protein [bacterium]